MIRIPIAMSILPALMIVALAGCGGTKLKPFNLTVALDDSLLGQPPTLQVDLVGVGADDSRLRDLAVDEYFDDESMHAELEAAGRIRTFIFQDGSTQPRTIASDDAMWKAWRRAGVNEMMIVVDYLPGTRSDAARRRMIPLSRDRWGEQSSDVEITIERAAVRVHPEPLP
jgi:hypothetical protein